jgi:ketosteroid isomerase-like protein
VPEADRATGLARSPSELATRWRIACDCCDASALLSLYEDEALLVASSGEVLEGRHAMREALSALLVIPPTYRRGDARRRLEADGVALFVDTWTLGKPHELTAHTTLDQLGLMVARRQSDGSWLISIDVPHGTI